MAEVKDPRGIGSPPHTWRILFIKSSRVNDPRITSTYVENTDFAFDVGASTRDHLHIRGEY